MIFNKKLTERAYAKINLYLDVTAKRCDGFHDIKSIMQSVSLYDEITVSLTESGGDVLTCNFENIPTDKRNLVIKAADIFRRATGKAFGLKAHIEKKIPEEAGLAGGSSDAAAMLRLLKKLCRDGISEEKMLEISAEIGADVPFCYIGGTALCEGKGEEMRALPKCPCLHLVVSKKGDGISTPQAYGALDALYGDFSKKRTRVGYDKLCLGLVNNDVSLILENLYNIFESVTEPIRPEIGNLKRIMRENSAIATLMCGSGPSVFGIFADENTAYLAEKALLEYGARAYYCTT